MTKKTTKRALLMSALSLLLCISMLIGTTYAWFTDSVTSGNNIIKAGNLDVELEFYNADIKEWDKVTPTTNLFEEGTLWEPGHTEVVYLKVSNAGSLALKYNLGVNIISETVGTNVAKETFKLSDYIEFDAIETATESFFANREDARKAVVDSKIISAGFSKDSYLEKTGDAEFVALVVYMPETVGNVANYLTGTTAPQIYLGVNLVATQYTKESDSFGKDYDKDAAYIDPWTGNIDTAWYTGTETTYTLNTAEELAGLAKLVNAGNNFSGITIKLGSDINLANKAWTPIGTATANFAGTFDGCHKVIYNLNVTGVSGVGLIGIAGPSASIENITVKNATVSGNHNVGTILGYGYLSANSLAGCYVDNAVVVCTPLNDDANGDKAGIIAGVAINGNIYNNRVTNSKIYALRDFGSIVGMAQAENRDIKVYSNSAENVEMFYVSSDNANWENKRMGELVGRENPAGKTVTIEKNNVATNIVMNNSDGDDVKVATPESKPGKIEKNETVYYAPGDYDFPTISEGATIIGTEGVTFTDTLSGTLNNTTIKNVEIKAGNAQRWAYAEGTLVFEDCTFDASSVYAIHYDGLSGANITYRNCKIVGWVAIGSGAEYITFDNCEIYGNGSYGLIRLYSPGTIKDCYFDVSAVNPNDAFQDGIHAVDTTVLVENVTNANGKPVELFNISKVGAIVYEGVQYVQGNASLKNAIKDNNVVGLLDGTYEMSTAANNVTFIGESEEGTKINYTIQHSGVSKGSIWRLSHFKNLTFTNTVFTMAEGGNSTFTNVTFGAGFRNGYGGGVAFTDCTFGSNSDGYALHFQSDSNSTGTIKLNGCEFTGGKVHLGSVRTYEFTSCEFAEGTDFQVWSGVTLTNCTVNGVKVTAENANTFFPQLNLEKVTIL